MRKIENLPKWARQEILRLRANNVALKEERRQCDVGETKVSYYVSPDIDDVQYLPDVVTVVFHFPGNEIDVELRNGELSISSVPGTLVVRPVAANVVLVVSESI